MFKGSVLLLGIVLDMGKVLIFKFFWVFGSMVLCSRIVVHFVFSRLSWRLLIEMQVFIWSLMNVERYCRFILGVWFYVLVHFPFQLITEKME